MIKTKNKQRTTTPKDNKTARPALSSKIICKDGIYTLDMRSSSCAQFKQSCNNALANSEDFIFKKESKSHLFKSNMDLTRRAVQSHFMFSFGCFCPQLLQLFRRMLQLCFDVTLLKCLVDYETSPGFPSAWRWWDNDRLFIFEWTVPFIHWAYLLTGIL